MLLSMPLMPAGDHSLHGGGDPLLGPLVNVIDAPMRRALPWLYGLEFCMMRTSRDRSDFDAYTNKFAVKRVDFEVSKNHGREVAPGINLGVSKTDVSYQRVSGSVWTSPDRHTTWLRQLKVQEPVFLTSFADGRTRELVITRVNKTGAIGYVLMPANDTFASTATN